METLYLLMDALLLAKLRQDGNAQVQDQVLVNLSVGMD